MEFQAPQAIIAGALITLLSGAISGLIVRNIHLPRKRNRIRSAIVNDIAEMSKIMQRHSFDFVIEKVRSREWKNFPRVVDASLPQEPLFKLFQDNIELFEVREIELIIEFFRRLKLSRAFCIALLDTSTMNLDEITSLCSAAQDEWTRVTSSAQQVSKEVKIV